MRRPRPRAARRAPGNRERWLVSYADFITLLFAFFTTLYAISVIDAEKGTRLVRSIRESFGSRLFDLGENGPGGAEWSFAAPEGAGARDLAGAYGRRLSPRLSRVESRVQDLSHTGPLERGIRVRRTEEGLVISLAATQFFETGTTRLSKPAIIAISKVASLIKDLPNHVRVEGHTDDRPVSTAALPSNWHLSVARAVAVVRELEKAGIARYRLSASGFADQRPLVSNRTAAGRRINRRVDLVLLRSQMAGGDPAAQGDL